MYLQKPIRSLFLLLFPCFLLVLSSCQSDQESSTPSSEGQGTLSFTVSNYRQISFDDISVPTATRADTPTDDPSTLAHLLFAVYNAETGQQAIQPIQHDYENYKNSSSQNDYSKFSVTLPYGHYYVVVLGFNGSSKCNVASVNHISWEGNYVPNTFLYYQDLTFDKNTSLDQKLTLKHVVTAFRVTAEDAIPAELKKMRFTSSMGGTVLDAATGFTPQDTGRTGDMIVPASGVGKQGIYFTSYLFLSDEQAKSNYTVQALGKNDAVLYEKHFNDVPLRINSLTVWEGKFFETSTPDDEEYNVGFNLYWDTQWADTIKVSSL